MLNLFELLTGAIHFGQQQSHGGRDLQQCGNDPLQAQIPPALPGQLDGDQIQLPHLQEGAASH